MVVTDVGQRLLAVFRDRGISEAIQLVLAAIVARGYGYFHSQDLVTDGAVTIPNSDVLTNNEIGRIRFKWHERSERQAVVNHLPEDLPVVELGAGVGYISAYIDDQIQREHLAVEANESLRSVLEQSQELNSCSYTIVTKAYSPTQENISLSNESSYASRSVESNTGDVVTTNLRTLVDEYGFDKFSLVADIEGGEQWFIEDENDILTQRCECIIVEWHDTASEADLLDMGFERVASYGDVRVFKNQNVHQQ